MTTTKTPDGPEDVNDFLLRIRELGERRDKEDDERTKRLEDEILQGRKERQACRAGTLPAPPLARWHRHACGRSQNPALFWRDDPPFP